MPKGHQPIYREVLRQAWIIVYKNKFLWVLGFFASFISGVGIYDIVIRGLRGAVSRGALNASLYPADALGLGAISIPVTLLAEGGPLLFVIPVMLVVAFAVAVLTWLAVNSLAGSMHATSKIIKGGRPDLRDAMSAGAHHFWPVLGVSLASRTVASLFLAGVSFPVFLAVKDSGAVSSVLYILLFLILVPLSLTVSFLGLFTSAGIVVRDQKWLEALKTAWLQFSKHWIVSLEMALILLGLGAAVAICTLLLVLVGSVPFVVLAVVAGLFAGKAGASFRST